VEKSKLMDLYREMVRVREFETKVSELFAKVRFQVLFTSILAKKLQQWEPVLI